MVRQADELHAFAAEDLVEAGRELGYRAIEDLLGR